LALAAASAALTAAGCGGGESAAEPQRLSDAELRERIEGTGNGRQEDDIVVRTRAVERDGRMVFANDRPSVRMGQVRLELVNPAAAPRRHSMSLEGHGIFKNDFDATPGRVTFIRSDLGPGRYAFYCSKHRDRGMEGTLTVVSDPAIEAKLARK
jgi:plastocyanin